MDYGGAISFVADKFHFLMLMKNIRKFTLEKIHAHKVGM